MTTWSRMLGNNLAAVKENLVRENCLPCLVRGLAAESGRIVVM